jgi:hypothetical protein
MTAKHFVNKVVAKMMVTSTWPFPSQEELGYFENKAIITPQIMGINITHCMGDNGKGGVTIAWRKASDTKNARMVEVAVAYCSPSDTFTKKIGKELAMDSFMEGNTVFVPARTCKSDDTIPSNLRDMFWYSINM